MDGSVRQITPLSPALHLGARRLVVIAVGQFAGQRDGQGGAPAHGAGAAAYPSFAQLAGHALSSIFLDNLGADVDRLLQINRLVDALDDGARRRLPFGHVDVFVMTPSVDLGELGRAYVHRLPRTVRALLRGLGSARGTGANLPSYLLFDRGFCRRLMTLGYADAMARRDELAAFLATDGVRYSPLLARAIA
jgi:NTE family protein